jgi:hypothetical protein
VLRTSVERSAISIWKLCATEPRMVPADSMSANIESLTDEQVIELLDAKWIAPLMAALDKIPDNIIANLVSRVRALADKYAATYAEVAGQITKRSSHSRP